MIISQLEITTIEASGHGSATYNNRKILVLGAFPGDIIDAKIYKSIKNTDYAEIIKVHFFSKLRENNEIEFNSNSPWLNLSHNGELELKENIYKNIFPEIHTQDIFSPSKEHSLRYRNKVAYAFIRKNNSELAFALYTRGDGKAEKIEQKENILVHPELERVGKKFLGFFNKHKVSMEQIKYLILRYSYYTNSVVAHILFHESNRKKLSFKKTDLEKFINSQKNIQGALVSHSPFAIRSSVTTKDFYELGNIHICEKVLDKKYFYHPSLFFQIYPLAFSEILSDLRTEIEKIRDRKKMPALDLFAGVGIIGIEIADLIHFVSGVELSSLSAEYALKNAQENDIQNFSFHEKSVDDILNEIKREQILIVDPTRAGLSKKSCAKILEEKPEYIFYISCNPETQARDIEILKNAYEITFARAYNIFPKTHHFESFIVLRKGTIV